jgi:TRAP-type C4-dicarboxylate transport system substrate-binding protein
MKKSWMPISVICALCAVVLLLSFSIKEAAAGPIVIKGITGLPENHLAAQPFFKVMELFNKRAKGEAEIKYLGGPEVFAPPNQAMAVKRGSVHMSQNFAAAYAGMVPMAKALPLSHITPKEERENGAYEMIKNLHSEAGLMYLGRAQSAPPQKGFFWIWTVKEVKSPADLRGLRIGGVSPAANEFIQALGAVPKIVGIAEGYTAVERGVIDGWWITFEDVVSTGMHEVLPYIIDHPWYCDNNTFIINPDFFKSLPKHIQDLLIQCVSEVENTWYYEVEKMWAKDKQIMVDAGMKFIYFSEEDAKNYVTLAYDSLWADIEKKYPEKAAKLKALFSKK